MSKRCWDAAYGTAVRFAVRAWNDEVWLPREGVRVHLADLGSLFSGMWRASHVKLSGCSESAAVTRMPSLLLLTMSPMQPGRFGLLRKKPAEGKWGKPRTRQMKIWQRSDLHI